MTLRTRTRHWCEEIVAERLNCGAEVVLIRFDDEDIATGYCTVCATVVEQDLYEQEAVAKYRRRRPIPRPAL